MEQHSDDYVFFELLDENFVMDAMNQLRRRYPNAMGLGMRLEKNAKKMHQLCIKNT